MRRWRGACPQLSTAKPLRFRTRRSFPSAVARIAGGAVAAATESGLIMGAVLTGKSGHFLRHFFLVLSSILMFKKDFFDFRERHSLAHGYLRRLRIPG
jgi:hypothetical protein